MTSKLKEQLMAIANKNEDHLASYTGNIELVESLIDILIQQQAALEFYANGLSWDWPITGNEENSMINFDDCSEIPEVCDHRGGKRARGALTSTNAKLKALGCE